MRRRLVAMLGLVVAACGRDEPVPPEVESNAVEAAEVASAEPMPVLLRYKPPEQGGPEAFRTAIIHGVLDFAGPCVRLQDESGRLATVVTSAGARLLRDTAGPYWPSRFERLRHGSSVTGGGGEIASLPADEILDGPVPDACRAGPAVELNGVRRPPQGPPAPTSPPPPPAD